MVAVRSRPLRHVERQRTADGIAVANSLTATSQASRQQAPPAGGSQTDATRSVPIQHLRGRGLVYIRCARTSGCFASIQLRAKSEVSGEDVRLWADAGPRYRR